MKTVKQYLFRKHAKTLRPPKINKQVNIELKNTINHKTQYVGLFTLFVCIRKLIGDNKHDPISKFENLDFAKYVNCLLVICRSS